MVERRPTLGILAHVVLLLGVLIVAFPLYVTFVASTQTADEILQAAIVGIASGFGAHDRYTHVREQIPVGVEVT